MMKLWPHTILFWSLLTEVANGSKLQATSRDITLTSSISKSGRQTVCKDETVVYSCSTTNLLKWKIKSRESATLIDILRHASDKTLPFWRDGQYFATFEGNLSSQLVIPYTPGWDGAEVQCMSQNENESLSYAITELPTPPSSVWHNVTQHYVNLHWNTTCDNIDCGMAMITVGDDNLQNTTYRAGGVTTLDVVEYLSYNDSIVIKIHGINKCNVKSNYSVNITVKIDTHSATREKGNCNKWQITLGVSIPAAIAMGAVVECVVRALYRYHNKNDPLPIKTLKGKQTNNESL